MSLAKRCIHRNFERGEVGDQDAYRPGGSCRPTLSIRWNRMLNKMDIGTLDSYTYTYTYTYTDTETVPNGYAGTTGIYRFPSNRYVTLSTISDYCEPNVGDDMASSNLY